MRTANRSRLGSLLLLVAILLAGRAVGQAPEVVIVAGQRVYHADACSQTASLNPSYLRSVKRDSLGAEFTACTICRPDQPRSSVVAAPAAMERELEELWSRYDASEMVTIILGPRTTGLYHRKGCHWENGGDRRVFARKDADARFFQPHQECMRRPPDTFTAEAEEALRKGQPTPVRALVGGGAATPAPSAAVSPPSTPAPVRSTARQQCAATTKKGARCSRRAAVGSAYCWQHP